MKKMIIFCFILFNQVFLHAKIVNDSGVRATNAKRIEHVVFIGIDGYGKNNFKRGSLTGAKKPHIPNIMFIKNSGAWTLDAKIDSRAFSGPNWMGMLTGSSSRKHGVKTNNCERGNGLQTIFEVIRNQRPDAEVGVIYDWKPIGCYPLENSVSFSKPVTSQTTQNIAEEAVSYIKEKRPYFLFTYFGAADEAGHVHKGNSYEYNKAVEEIDRGIGKILDALREENILSKTLVILTSDHGQMRLVRGHTWRFTPVPLFMMGPNIVKGKMKKKFGKMRIRNNIIAPLIAYALGLEPSPQWNTTIDPVLNYFKH